MRKSSVCAAAVASAALAFGSLGVFATTAFASATNGTTHSNPSGLVVLSGPPPVPLPSNCPAFLSGPGWELMFTGGNSVSHGTANNNGDWGGSTAEGPAVLTLNGTVLYTGHLTTWEGGGQNSITGANQTEGGMTVNFNGTGPAGSLSLHVNAHSTTNNSGTTTANILNVVCG